MSSATSGSRGFRGPRPPCRGAAGFSLGGGRRASGNALLSSQSSKMRRIASRGRHRSGRTHSSARRVADVFEAPMRNATRCAGASRAGITWFCSFACAGRKDSPPGGQQSHSTPKAGLCLIVRRTILQAGQARARTTIVTLVGAGLRKTASTQNKRIRAPGRRPRGGRNTSGNPDVSCHDIPEGNPSAS